MHDDRLSPACPPGHHRKPTIRHHSRHPPKNHCGRRPRRSMIPCDSSRRLWFWTTSVYRFVRQQAARMESVAAVVTDGGDENEGRPCPPEPIKDRPMCPQRQSLLPKSTNLASRLSRQQNPMAPPRDGDDANDDRPCQSPCQPRGRHYPISSRSTWTNLESRFHRHGRARRPRVPFRPRPTAREGDDTGDGPRCPPGR